MYALADKQDAKGGRALKFTILYSLLGECRMLQRIYPGLFIITLLLYGSTAGLAAQTCVPALITASTPTADFTVNNDGTVTHKKTGLMWKVCSEGQTWNATGTTCSGLVLFLTWQSALQQATTANAGSGFAGFNDWRLPNVKELDSIQELQCMVPTINATIFPATEPTPYWSATPDAIGGNTGSAQSVDFQGGNIGSTFKSHIYSVRLVRGGQ